MFLCLNVYMSTPDTKIVPLVLTAAIAGALGGAWIAPLFKPVSAPPVSRPAEEMEEPSAGTLQETVYLDEESAVIDVVAKVNPAVVNISILKDISRFSPSAGDPFENFFFEFGFPFERPRPAPRPEPENRAPDFQPVGGGSGFLIEPDGLIVTNRHVVEDDDAKYQVSLANGKEYEATIVAKDPVLDVALIKIEGVDLPTLALGDSDKLKLGQTVIAIGNALSEFGNTVTRGVVSGIGRRVEAGNGRGLSEVIEEAIQTDAAINPGNSGGPLLNFAGEVIGINTAVSREGQLVGFAIPINSVKRTIESVRATGRIVRPWLGVRYVPITPRLSELNKLPVTYGILIIRGESAEELAVIPGSPADKAGLVENDIILEIDGEKLEERESLVQAIAKHAVGDSVKLKVLHRGEEKEVTATLSEFPTDS